MSVFGRLLVKIRKVDFYPKIRIKFNVNALNPL